MQLYANVQDRIHAISCGLKTEIPQNFKGDLIKFCEIFTKITLELPQNSQKPLFKCKKLVITQQSVIYVYFFIKCVVKWSENSVRFEKSYGNWLPDGLNSVRFYGMYETSGWRSNQTLTNKY